MAGIVHGMLSLGLLLHFKRWGKDGLDAGEVVEANHHELKWV
jgi:hypothetical protein